MRCFLQKIHKVLKFCRGNIYSALLVSFCSQTTSCAYAAKLLQFATDFFSFPLRIYEQMKRNSHKKIKVE